MRVCPKCGHEESLYWRPARWDNPDGELDVCRISDFETENLRIALLAKSNRNHVIIDGAFAYLLTKRASYIKRVRTKFYQMGGCSAFKVPWENSKTHEQRNQVQTDFPLLNYEETANWEDHSKMNRFNATKRLLEEPAK